MSFVDLPSTEIIVRKGSIMGSGMIIGHRLGLEDARPITGVSIKFITYVCSSLNAMWAVSGMPERISVILLKF